MEFWIKPIQFTNGLATTPTFYHDVFVLAHALFIHAKIIVRQHFISVQARMVFDLAIILLPFLYQDRISIYLLFTIL